MTPRLLKSLQFIAILSYSNLTWAADACTANAEYDYQISNHTVFFHNTSTSTGVDSEWQWDFGDGNLSTITDPIYAYPNYGTYDCCLTITSSSLAGPCSDTFCLEIHIEPDSACVVVADFQIELLVNGEAMFIPDCQTNLGTQIDGFLWEFDSLGLSQDEAPLWQFLDAEMHQVCLTAHGLASENLCADVKCQEVVIDNFLCELGAEFKLTLKECGVDLNYQFDQLGTFTVATEFNWTFSDGTLLEGANVSHTFAEPGEYEVCLSVIGNCPSSTCMSQKCMTVNVECPDPIDWSLTELSDNSGEKDEDDTSLDVETKNRVEIRVYPNPTTDYLRIESQAGIETISAWTAQGQLVLSDSAQGMKQHIVDVSSLTRGMYVYSVRMSDGQVATGQITKL